MMVNRSVTPVLFWVCESVLDLKINLEINVINEIKKIIAMYIISLTLFSLQ